MDLREIPEWVQIIMAIVITVSCVLTTIIVIMMVSHWTAGPPETCGTSGVHQIMSQRDDQGDINYLVVCNNGRSYWP